MNAQTWKPILPAGPCFKCKVYRKACGKTIGEKTCEEFNTKTEFYCQRKCSGDMGLFAGDIIHCKCEKECGKHNEEKSLEDEVLEYKQGIIRPGTIVRRG